MQRGHGGARREEASQAIGREEQPDIRVPPAVRRHRRQHLDQVGRDTRERRPVDVAQLFVQHLLHTPHPKVGLACRRSVQRQVRHRVNIDLPLVPCVARECPTWTVRLVTVRTEVVHALLVPAPRDICLQLIARTPSAKVQVLFMLVGALVILRVHVFHWLKVRAHHLLPSPGVPGSHKRCRSRWSFRHRGCTFPPPQTPFCPP